MKRHNQTWEDLEKQSKQLDRLTAIVFGTLTAASCVIGLVMLTLNAFF